MNQMLKSTMVLAGVCFIAALLLGLAYIVTAERIAMEEEIALKKTLGQVLPGADNFTQLDGIYKAMKAGKTIGFAALAEAEGYSAIIKMLIGMDMDKKITGFRVLDHAETPGLGANVAKPDFYKQFDGLSLEDLKLSKEGGKIDAITGATITSTAVIEGARKSVVQRLEIAVDEGSIDAVTKATEIYEEEAEEDVNATIKSPEGINETEPAEKINQSEEEIGMDDAEKINASEE
jgi:electron transport complex protein RnfG